MVRGQHGHRRRRLWGGVNGALPIDYPGDRECDRRRHDQRRAGPCGRAILLARLAEGTIAVEVAVADWRTGIDGRHGITVSKNQVADNLYGIVADGGSVVGNVAINNRAGIFVKGTANATGNATYGNHDFGIFVTNPFVGVITKNNIFGNECGLFNLGVVGVAATNNYWGAPTGPGGGAADTTCNENGGTTDVTPFATKPFAVKVLKP